MVPINPTISIIILNGNCLNSSLKRQRLSSRSKKWSTICYLQKLTLNIKTQIDQK